MVCPAQGETLEESSCPQETYLTAESWRTGWVTCQRRGWRLLEKMKTVMILPTASINAPSYLRTLYGVLSYI